MHELPQHCWARVLAPIVAAVLTTASAGAEDASADPSPIIKRLVTQLGAPALAARQAAEKELLEIGLPALAALEAATKSENIEIRLRAEAIAALINERRIAEADVHVIGVYESGSADRRVVVRIDSATRPVVLVVCARETVEWIVQPAKGIEIVKVIASGHFPQKVLGTSARVQSLSAEGDDPPKVKQQAFYTYRNSGLLYDAMCERIKELTGKDLASFQGRYDGESKPFVIGGK